MTTNPILEIPRMRTQLKKIVSMHYLSNPKIHLTRDLIPGQSMITTIPCTKYLNQIINVLLSSYQMLKVDYA